MNMIGKAMQEYRSEEQKEWMEKLRRLDEGLEAFHNNQNEIIAKRRQLHLMQQWKQTKAFYIAFENVKRVIRAGENEKIGDHDPNKVNPGAIDRLISNLLDWAKSETKTMIDEIGTENFSTQQKNRLREVSVLYTVDNLEDSLESIEKDLTNESKQILKREFPYLAEDLPLIEDEIE